MRAFRSWLKIVAVAAGAIGVFVAVAIARELKPSASRRRQAVGVEPHLAVSNSLPQEPAGSDDAAYVAMASLPLAVAMQPPAAASSPSAGPESRSWGRLVVAAGVAVFALVAVLGVVTSSGGTREPALQASVVQSAAGDVLLVKGQNFPPGETVDLGLADVAGAETSVRSSQSGDFMVQIAAPAESSRRTLKVLAAVAGKRVSAAAAPGAAVLGVSSDFAQVGAPASISQNLGSLKTPISQPTMAVQGSVTKTKTVAATATATRTRTASTAIATGTKAANATATRAVPSSTATARPPVTATPRPPTATPTKTAIPAATSTSAPTGGVMTFGKTGANGIDDDSNWNHINGTRVSVTNRGVLKSLSVYVGAGPQGKIRLALYSGDASGPRQLVAQTGEAVAREGWNKIVTTSAPMIGVGTYYVVAQTDSASTVYRMAPDGNTSASLGWTNYAYGPFPATVGAWHSVGDWSFSMNGTVATLAGETPFTVTPAAQATATPPTGALNPPAAQATPLPTLAIPETATAAALPPTSTSTTTPAPTPGGGAGCVTNCGTPRFFCDTGAWAFCDDYRDLYCPSLNFLNDCKFPDMDGIGRHVSVVSYSSTDPDYYPQVENVFSPHGWFFNQQEHFHSQIEDGSFGIAMARHHQPIDLGAERRIHFEIDLKTSARRYVRLMLSPDVTKSMVDDRDPPNEYRPAKALDIWFVNGTFVGSVYPSAPDGNAFFVQSPRYYGTDNVRDLVDVYVTKTHVKVVVNGTTYVDENIPNVGFDQAYVYLEQASYNPCKDNECAEKLQIFHWDNFAFDGPVLADNSLVPAGQQDVVFMAYGQASCSVKGVTATPASQFGGFTWISWVARMPVQAVSPSDVSCTNGEGGQFWADTGRTPFDFEVVKR